MFITPTAILNARKRLGENQKTFANRFGVDQSTVSRWEREKVKFTGPVRILLERVLWELRQQMRRVG